MWLVGERLIYHFCVTIAPGRRDFPGWEDEVRHGCEKSSIAGGARLVMCRGCGADGALHVQRLVARPTGPASPQAGAAAIPQQALDGPQVLVATKALPVGTIIEADSFRFQPWPKDLIETAYYLQGKADPQSLQGAVVRNAITAGQPVTQGALIKPGERGFLAAALGPGMRAVTVPVNMQSSVAGFIFPGDRVDVLGDADGKRRRCQQSAARYRDHRAQPARARYRPTHQRDGRNGASPMSAISPTSPSK
jgi:hypothetical protein